MGGLLVRRGCARPGWQVNGATIAPYAAITNVYSKTVINYVKRLKLQRRHRRHRRPSQRLKSRLRRVSNMWSAPAGRFLFLERTYAVTGEFFVFCSDFRESRNNESVGSGKAELRFPHSTSAAREPAGDSAQAGA